MILQVRDGRRLVDSIGVETGFGGSGRVADSREVKIHIRARTPQRSSNTEPWRLRRRRAGKLVDVFDGERTATRGGPRVHRPADRERHDWRATLRTPRQARGSCVPLPVVARVAIDVTRVSLPTITSVATRRLIGHVGHPTTTPIVGNGSDTDPGREAGENGRYDRRARGLCLAGGYAFMASSLHGWKPQSRVLPHPGHF